MTQNQEIHWLLYAAHIIINQHWSLQEDKVFHKWSAMYNKVPPVCSVDSVGVNSKEKVGIFIFFTILVSLSILVSEIAIKISNNCLTHILDHNIAKCNLFFHYNSAKEISLSFYYFWETKLCGKDKKIYLNPIYINVIKVN